MNYKFLFWMKFEADINTFRQWMSSILNEIFSEKNGSIQVLEIQAKICDCTRDAYIIKYAKWRKRQFLKKTILVLSGNTIIICLKSWAVNIIWNTEIIQWVHFNNRNELRTELNKELKTILNKMWKYNAVIQRKMDE